MREKARVRRVLIIGANPAGIAAATKLGEMGIPVTMVEESADIHEFLGREDFLWPSGLPSNFALRPGLLRLMRNPLIDVRTSTALRGIKRMAQGFRATLERNPTYIDPERCIQCGKCIEACPVVLPDGSKPIKGSARWSLPGGYSIDKRRAAECSEGCPLGVNVQGYIALTRAGKYQEALDLIRRDNVLPGVCGRVCTHPCELECRRSEVDSPLAIRDIKRFLADRERELGASPRLAGNPRPGREERVLVVGSGPAGLAAAADLARAGYRVTVLEKMEKPGGLLRYGIGPYRLPREVLDEEIAAIEDLGVEIVTGRPVELPGDLASLKEEFDAVLVATGSWRDHVLGVPGEDLRDVYGCIELLKDLYSGGPVELPRKVAVIGDGNSAMDAARAFRRLGCEVTIVSWFPRELIPAADEDVSDALAEGVDIVDSTQVVGFEGEDGALTALRCAPTEPGPPDANGIPWPVIIEGGEEFLLGFEAAVVAIGQRFEPLGLEGSGVFVAGDAARGPSSVVDAMRSGRDSARAIHEALSGQACLSDTPCRRPEKRDFPPIPEELERGERACPNCLEAAARTQDFREVVSALNDEQSQMEAGRCLMCGVCSECLECVEACGIMGAVRHDDEPARETIQAGVVILTDPRWAKLARGTDVMRAYPRRGPDTNVMTSTVRGFAAAGEAMSLLGMDDLRRPLTDFGFSPPDVALAPEVRTGLFLCRCNDSLGWDDRIHGIVKRYEERPGVEHTEILESICRPSAIEGIIKTIHEKNLTRVILASCVCCPLNFICGSCTDQRSLLKSLLFSGTGINRAMFETCNIRGEALSWFRVDREQATVRLEGLLERSILRAARLISRPLPHRLFNFTTAVVGDSEAARICAGVLASTGLAVYHIGGPGAPLEMSVPAPDGVQVWRGSRVRGIRGQLGNFSVLFEYDGEAREVRAGVVIYGENTKQCPLPYSPSADQPFREVETMMQRSGVPGVPFIMPGATSIAGLFLVQPPRLRVSDAVRGHAAAVLAACASRRQARQYKGYTVVVNEQLCRHCGRCVQACPYQAVTFQPNALGLWKAVVDEALCKGCGNCISACPTGAADSPYRNQRHLENMLSEILAPRAGSSQPEGL